MCRFGGGNGRESFNDTWCFDTSSKEWIELLCKGDVPSPRVSHTGTLIDNVLFIFGGQNRLYTHISNDLYALDLHGTYRFWIRFAD
jgi:hypothetical protein